MNYLLSPEQIADKKEFIQQYRQAINAASGSKVDSNANVTQKNLATLESELMKDYMIQINRQLLCDKISEHFSAQDAQEYLDMLENHIIYTHDETSLKPYCVSISMYPFLLDGLTTLGGESQAPRHLESFCGSFVNLVFAISSQFAGALATVEFLTYFDHFAAKDYGDDYLDSHPEIIANHFQHVVYSINQPAAARGYQSVFWNISIFDEYYFNSLFENFRFPDFIAPSFKRVSKLQKYFMHWFNQERLKAILTFPVITAAMLSENGKPKDEQFAEFCAQELSEGNSFFIYQSDSADSLASCCRLRNEMLDNTFSYSLGAGGIATGSINVITLNISRIIQKNLDLKTIVEKVQKFQVAYRKLIEEYYHDGLLPVYNAGFIALDKQFLTIGVNGLVEAAESQGLMASNNPEYIGFIQKTLKIIFDCNKVAYKKYGVRFNTEMVPAENLGVKNAKWDTKDNLYVPRECYNSYFYPVENEQINILDKMILHGKEIVGFLDGGSALHLNLEQNVSQKAFLKLIYNACALGCNYFTFNVRITLCNSCNHIDKRTLSLCPACNSTDIDHATRIIGYLKRISAFSEVRQEEHNKRHYHTSLVKQDKHSENKEVILP